MYFITKDFGFSFCSVLAPCAPSFTNSQHTPPLKTCFSWFSLVSIYQTHITSFDRFLKLFLFGFFQLIWLGLELELPLRLGVRVGVGFELVT